MKDKLRAQERNGEIVSFFYAIFGHRIHGGMNPEDARNEAYDAVSLRYGIGKGRLLNIISGQRHSRRVNDSVLRQNAIALIRELETANSGLDEAKAKNDRLIGLLKECIDGS